MKKFLSIVLSLAMVFSLSATAAATENATTTAKNKDGLTKAEFVAQIRKTRTATTITENEENALLFQYSISSESKRAELESELNSAGIYIYSDGSENTQTRSEPSDITLNNVICSYNDNTGDWSLVAGGSWDDINVVRQECDVSWIYNGLTVNIGGTDAVGMTIYNTSGTTPALKTSFATIYEDGTAKTLNNPSIYDTNRGIAFEYQDKYTFVDIYSSPIQGKYYGEGFACVMRFGSSFINWNGFARSYYTHTWKNTVIDSLGFNIGVDSVGFDVSWAEGINHMELYSNGDTQF